MKNKKFIIISSSIVVFLLMVLLIVILIKPSNTKRLEDPTMFFTLQEIINNDVQNDYYMQNSYTIENVYVKNYDLINIYFVNGFYIGRNEEADYKQNQNYVVKTKGILYESYKLNNVTDIKEYAENYDEEDITVNSKNVLPTVKYDEKEKLVFYIATFKNLLEVDYQKSYSYLTKKAQDKYSDEDNFGNQKDIISVDIQTSIKDYQKEVKKDETVYRITTSSNKTITIYEYGLMNYKIEY